MKVDIIAPDRTRHFDELCDLSAKVFSHDQGYYPFLDYCRQTYYHQSSYDWSASRIAVVAGRIAAHVGVWAYDMRVGGAWLKTGGIGAVLTEPRHRRRGLGAQVFRATQEAMRQAGYLYSVLFGIRNYYHRFGYAVIWGRTTYRIDPENMPKEPLKLRMGKLPLAEVLCGNGQAMKLYRRDHGNHTGMARRPMYCNPANSWPDRVLTGLFDPAGKMHGYLVTRKRGKDLEVFEASGFASPCSPGQLLAAAGVLARKQGCGSVSTYFMSPAHPLCQLLRRSDCRAETQYSSNGGTMGWVVDLAGALETMTPELNARLADSALAGYSGRLRVVGGDQTVTLVISRGSVSVAAGGASVSRVPSKLAGVIHAGPASARLLVGSEHPQALAVQGEIRFQGDALRLAEVLFPDQQPSIGALDGF